MYDVLPDLKRWQSQGELTGLATVISTWGSAPRGVGAKMAFTLDGKLSGSVSGGCVEGAVFDAGERAIKSGKAELLHFGVADETAFDVGLACGGNIEVFVRRLEPGIFEVLRQAIESSVPVAEVTVISGPEALVGLSLVCAGGEVLASSLGAGLDTVAVRAAEEAIKAGQSRSISQALTGSGTARLFVDAILPPPVLVMVGGVHIAIALSSVAKAIGYRTVVIDPRRAFGSSERFPNVDQLIQEWPETAFQQVSLAENTCVAMLTHDPKIDDPALKIILNSPVFYIGALGSRATHEKRRKRLLAEGITTAQLDRIHAPIGLDIGGSTPEETALAVMAEIVAVRHGRV